MRTILILLLIFSCGKRPETPKIASHYSNGNESMSGEIRPYFDNFTDQAKCLNIPLNYNSLKIEILPDKISSIGVCTWSSDGNMNIVIDAGYWDKLSLPNREKVVVHELAHCTLRKSHTEGDIFKVMNSHLYTGLEWEFVNNYDQRIKEVFDATSNTECTFAYQDLEIGPDLGGTEMAMRIAPHDAGRGDKIGYGEGTHQHPEDSDSHEPGHID